MKDGLTRKRLKAVRESFGWTREDLAKKLNVSSQVVANLELGRKQIYADDIEKLAKIFGMTVGEFYGSEITVGRKISLDESELLDIYDQLSAKARKLVKNHASDLLEIESDKIVTFMPMLTETPVKTTEILYFDQAAGMGGGQYVENAIPEKIQVPSEHVPAGTDFAIRVVGDSMEPTYSSGDRLFIHRTNVLKVGDIGVFNYHGEQFVKEFGLGELISHNKDYPPMTVNSGELHIQGKVLGRI